MSRCRSIFHNEVDGTSNPVTFQICGHRLADLDSRQDFSREEVKRNETVLIVRTWYFYSVDQGIIIPFVHTAQNCVLPFSRRVAFHGHAGHSLNYVANGEVRSQFQCPGAHDVDHIGRIAHDFHRLGIPGA